MIDEPMSIAFADHDSEYSVGMQAFELMQHHMDQESWMNLQWLFSKYPDSTIEFSVFGRSVGTLGWNTVFWEVRNY